MIKVNYKRTKLLKKFKRDLFGEIILKRKVLIIRDFLLKLMKLKEIDYEKLNFYRVGLVEKPLYLRRRTKWCQYFFQRQKFRIFYGFLKIKVIKKIIKKSLKYKRAGDYFIYLLESRLDVLLYRLNLTKSIRMSRQLLLSGKVLINNKVIKDGAYNLKPKDILTFKPQIIQSLKKKIYLNLLTNKWALNFIPNYIEFSWKNLTYTLVNFCVTDVKFFFFSNRYTFLNLLNFYNKYLF